MADKTSSDFNEHERTYRGFLNIAKWAIVAIGLSMVVLYFLVQP